MKHITIILVFLFTSLSFGQLTKKSATLFFNNGDSLKCFARVSGANVRYAKTKKGKETKINYKELDHIEYLYKDDLTKVYFLKEKGKSKPPKLMQLITNGAVQVYCVVSGSTNNPSFITYKRAKEKMSLKSYIIHYFIKRKGDKEVVRISRHFKNNMISFFNDCKELVSNIKDEKKGFHKKDIVNIVEFYNTECK